MEKEKPIHEIQLAKIRATIWGNKSKNGERWFNVTLSRAYQEDGKWKNSTSLGRDDLPVANKAIDMAYGWILRHEQRLKMAKCTPQRKEG